MDDLQHVISTLPGFSGHSVDARPLPGGRSNTCFLLRHRGSKFVLRLSPASVRTEGRDRLAEIGMLIRIADAGIGPRLVFADPDRGILLTRFVDGTPLSADALRDPATGSRIAGLLRELHALPPLGRPLRIARFARHYAATLAGNQLYGAMARRCVSIIEEVGDPARIAPCHNDVIAQNLVADGGTVRLVDWEYAGDNDPLFDLATLIEYHALPAPVGDSLLAEYTGGATAELQERLRAQRRRFVALYWLWTAVQPHTGRDLARLEARIDE